MGDGIGLHPDLPAPTMQSRLSCNTYLQEFAIIFQPLRTRIVAKVFEKMYEKIINVTYK